MLNMQKEKDENNTNTHVTYEEGESESLSELKCVSDFEIISDLEESDEN